ncbi:MAG: efflux transporter outer membrane subunit [Hyphomicrobiales bacterium]|nr:efflux transporter outer membrane subunit [Hyphomicrobiales bacterium]
MKKPVFLAVAVSLTLGGCDLAPAYSPPALETPAHFKNASGLVHGQLGKNWWRAFRDAQLDRLEDDVDAANPDLAAALAAYDSARAFVGVAESGLFPQFEFQGAFSANKQSAHRPLRSSSQPNHYGANQMMGAVSYEIDLWGRVRNRIASAQATSQADAYLVEQTRLALHAELARDYIALRGLDAQAALLSRTIGVYRSALSLTKTLVHGQIAAPVDEQRALVQVANVEAQMADVAQRRAKFENAIAALTGRTASAFHIRPTRALPAEPRRPRSAPSELLLRRPDIAAQERLVYAANEDIGAAKAAFFPRLSIILSAGSQDTGFNLASLANSAWSVGPAVSMPIFDAGLRQAELEAARADYAGALARYKSAALAAFREVEDALASLRWLSSEVGHLSLASGAASKAESMSFALYRDGAASFLDVVTAQNAALEAQRADLSARTQLLLANVDLMLALGGGWTMPPPDPAQVVSTGAINAER